MTRSGTRSWRARRANAGGRSLREGHRQRVGRGTFLFATALITLILAPAALADPPSHNRAPALDLEGLNHACGVAVDSKGDLYASSAGTDEIKVYGPAPTRTLLTTISNANGPCGLAVDSKGNLYVSEQDTGKVVKYHPTAFPFVGTPSYEAPATIDSSGIAKGIAVDRTDDRLYVAKGTKVAIYTKEGAFEANVAEDLAADYTGVSAYTYLYTTSNPAVLKLHSYLTVADAATDQLKLFAAKEGSPLKLRRTISGVDHDEDPETANQSFGFGAAGAYLAADPGNESRETRKCVQVEIEGNKQACTQGHFFVYDDANDAVDEFDATGEFVDQITNAAFADAAPTALAVERSGTASDGTLYVSAGASAGAKLLAFRPLMLPARDPLTVLSKVLTKARGVATDCEGYVYVAAESLIRVYKPIYDAEGHPKELKELTNFVDTEEPRDLAVDCEGNVYVVDNAGGEPILTYYSPSSNPPTGTTGYTRHEPPLIPGEFEGSGLQSVAVNPANGHVFAVGNGLFAPIVAEFDSAANGSGTIGECGAGLGLASGRLDIDVYGATGEVYVTANERNLATLRCGAEPELLVRQIKGGGCPNGEIGSISAIAIDQSNGHIIQFANNQTGAAAREYDSSGSCVAEFGSFSTTSGYRIAVDNSCALHDPPLTEATTPTCAATYPANGNAYVASDGSDNTVQPFDVTAFGPLEYPEGEEEPEPEEFELTVKKNGTGTGKVTGPGIDCGEDCKEKYLEGSAVPLAADADPGSEFTGWSGACSGTGSCEVTMTEAKEVTATFEEEEEGIPLSIDVEGTGSGVVTSDTGAISCDPFCSDEYPEGAVVILTATPAPGSVFVSWKYCDSGGVNGRQCTVTMSKAKTVKATFTTTHALEVSRAGTGLGKVQSSPGGILCLSNCSETTASFKEGVKVVLKQTPAKHFHFVEWLGDCTGSGACEPTMGEDHEVQAKFAEDPKHLLTLTKSGGGQGTVKSSVAGINCGAVCSQMASAYYQGEVVELTVVPGKGSAFGGWSGACSGTGTCTVTMSAAKEVTAEFK